MTQTSKCDTCRQRKVKCDEQRPKCDACRKKDRPCTYSYGKASALVVQDPNQLTKHGRSKVDLVVYALNYSEESSHLSGSASSGLRLTTEKKADDGKGVFRTLALMPNPKSRKATAVQKKKLKTHLLRLYCQSALTTHKPLSSESTLIARYIAMLGAGSLSLQPMSILGTWVQSIPSRIGSNRMLDLAVEFLINSYTVYWDGSHSNRILARDTKAKALRELQLVVSDSVEGPTYEVLLATKTHYAAETLMGVESMYHAIHAFGLAELLKSGTVTNVDDEHFWNLIDNTYVDDVNEAMLAGRPSVYDNDFYLLATYPTPRSSTTAISLSPAQRASVAIMHVFIQCPRLVCLVRRAITHPNDLNALASAVSLAESLWQINLPDQVSSLLESAITISNEPPLPKISDLLPNCLHFTSVQSMVLCTRYWMLQNTLCGLIDTLHRHFPAEAASAMFPDPHTHSLIDIHAALQLAKSLPWAESVSRDLPLVPLRLHTPLQISIGPWHRAIRRLTTLHASTPESELELLRARRMQTWLIDECNRIHKQWGVSVVAEPPLLEALDSMAGEKIPDWLPTRVRFEAEDGDVVVRLEYAGERQDGRDVRLTQTALPLMPSLAQDRRESDAVATEDLPFRNPSRGESLDVVGSSNSRTGTNPCMSPGWSAGRCRTQHE